MTGGHGVGQTFTWIAAAIGDSTFHAQGFTDGSILTGGNGHIS